MNQLHQEYINILKANSKLAGRKEYSAELKHPVQDALKEMELQMTAREIIQCIYEAFNTPIKFRSF